MRISNAAKAIVLAVVGAWALLPGRRTSRRSGIGEISSYSARAGRHPWLSPGLGAGARRDQCSRRRARPQAGDHRPRRCRQTGCGHHRGERNWSRSEHVDLLPGTILSHIGLAVADFARQKKVFFLASQPLTDALIWEKGNRYTFRLRPSTYTQASILAKEPPSCRRAAGPPSRRTDEFGQSAVASFKSELKRLRPDVEFVSEQWPPLGKIDAGAVVQAMTQDKPEAIFNATFGPDLAKTRPRGHTRNTFLGPDR